MVERPIHIGHVFATFAPGGPQVRIAEVLNRLRADFRHSILAMDGRFSTTERLSPDLDFSTVPLAEGLQGWSKIRAVDREIARLNVDILATHNWGSMDAVLARPFGPARRWIHMETGFEADEASGFKARRVIARRLLLRRAAAVVVPSKALVDVAKRLWHVPQDKLLYIENGVDLDRFQPGRNPKLRASLGIPEDAIVVGTVANLRPVKDPLKLLRAFAACHTKHKAHLVYVGGGPLRDNIEAEARKLRFPESVHCVGSQIDVSGFHRMFDIFCLSSKSEQSPVSVLEALACGKPILSTDVGDVRRNVTDANRAFVVPRSDVDSFAHALDQLCTDAPLREALGHANRTLADQRFNVNDMVQEYQTLYETVAGGN